jgi:hypothetical protein
LDAKLTELDPCAIAVMRYTDKRKWLNLWTMLLWIFGATVVLFFSVAIILFIKETWLPGAITVIGTMVNGAGITWVVTQRKGAEQEERDAFAALSTECGDRQKSAARGVEPLGAAPEIPTVRELSSRAWKSLLWGDPI